MPPSCPSTLPSITGNGLYAGIFGLFIVLQILFGIRYRSVGFLMGMLGVLLCEIIGYVGRIMMHSNPFMDTNFIMYLVCLCIGPTFLSASIYLCLSCIVIIFSESAARFQPKMYTFCDIVSLALQGAGCGVASTATAASTDRMGKNHFVGLAISLRLKIDFSGWNRLWSWPFPQE